MMAPPGSIPPGRRPPSREFIEARYRQRLMDAMARVAAERGLARVRISDVVSEAGVARGTFYEHYRSGEDCAEAAVQQGFQEALAAAEEAAATAEDREQRLRRSVAGLVEHLIHSADYARLCVVEAHALPRPREARDRGVDHFVAAVHAGLGEAVGETRVRLVVGGVLGMIYKRVVADPKLLDGLQGEIADFAVASLWEALG